MGSARASRAARSRSRACTATPRRCPTGLLRRQRLRALARRGRRRDLRYDRHAFSDDAINCSLQEGRYNQVLRLTGYNGLPDDYYVRVDFYASTGLEEQAGSGPCFSIASAASQAAAWKRRARSFPHSRERPRRSDEQRRGTAELQDCREQRLRAGRVSRGVSPQGDQIKLFGDSEMAPAVQFNLRQAVVAARLKSARTAASTSRTARSRGAKPRRTRRARSGRWACANRAIHAEICMRRSAST